MKSGIHTERVGLQRKATDAGRTCEFILEGVRYLLVAAQYAVDPEHASGQRVGACEIDGVQYCILKPASAAEAAQRLAETLTGRELQVATMVALGWVNKEIANRLHLSEWTVGTYLRRIFAKLGVNSRAAMVYRCAPLIKSTSI